MTIDKKEFIITATKQPNIFQAYILQENKKELIGTINIHESNASMQLSQIRLTAHAQGIPMDKALKEMEKMNLLKLIEEHKPKQKQNIDSITLIAANKKREATEKLVQEIISTNYIYSTRDDENSEMWIYQKGIYVPQAKTYIREYCRQELNQAYTNHIANEVISKIETDTYTDQEKFFNQTNIEEIAIENGILNIFTKELTTFTPKKIFFNKLPVTFDPIKKCPNIIKHFETVLKNKEEDLKVMQETFGYLLLKENRYEKAFMFSGDGRNGKTKTLEIIKRFIGPKNCTGIPLQQFETKNNQYAKGELLNIMANIAGDISDEGLKITEAFKTLIGRDFISSNRKFKTMVHFQNYAKLIFAANQLPNTKDNSLGFWSKWIYFEFPNTFVTEEEFNKLNEKEKVSHRIKDPNIMEKIATEEELSGLLNWGLEGLDRLIKQKDFSDSKTSNEIKVRWIRKSNSFMAFLLDCCEEDYDGKIKKQELKSVYQIYCRKHKITKRASDKSIWGTLTGGELDYAVSSDRETVGENRSPYWQGIKFKTSESGKADIDTNGFSTCIGISDSLVSSNPIDKSVSLDGLDNLNNLVECVKCFKSVDKSLVDRNKVCSTCSQKFNFSQGDFVFSGKCVDCDEVRDDLNEEKVCLLCYKKQLTK